MQPLTDFAKTLPMVQSSSLSDRSRQCSHSLATESAKRLLGCYRRGEAEDAEIYTAALSVILSDYPERIVLHVADPRTGIAGTSQFLPTVAEVRHACEVEMKPIRDEIERERRRQETERIVGASTEARERRKTFAELRAAYPDVVGHSVIAPKVPASEAQKKTILADLEARKDYLRSPLTVSDELRRSNAEHTTSILSAIDE